VSPTASRHRHAGLFIFVRLQRAFVQARKYLPPLRNIEDIDTQRVQQGEQVMNPMRPMTRTILAAGSAVVLLAFAGAASAQTYTVNIKPELNGLNVKIEPVSNPGLLVVNLTNNDAQKIRCDLNFEADPQMPYRTFVFVEPGKRGSAVLQAAQKWYEVDVSVQCKPADKK
jgi:hypothetical protein